MLQYIVMIIWLSSMNFQETKSEQKDVAATLDYIDENNDFHCVSHNKIKRSLPSAYFAPPKTCYSSKEELKALDEEIAKQFEELRMPKTNSADDSCALVISSIKNRINYIFDQVKLMRAADNKENEIFENLKKEVENEKGKLNKAVEQLNKNYDQEISRMANKLNTTVQDFQNLFNEKVKEIDELRAQNTHYILKECLVQIQNVEYSNELTECNKLDFNYFNDTNLEDIITKCYTEHSIKSGNIFKFVKLLHYNRHILTLTTLFKLMKKESNLSEMLVLNYIVRRINNNPFLSSYFEILKLRKDIQFYADGIIRLWANKISNGNFDVVLDFAHKYETEFQFHLPQIFHETYPQKDIFSFIDKLTVSKHIVSVYRLLYEQIKTKEGNEYVQLAYRVKSMFNNPLTPDLLKELHYINSSMPQSVKQLIWKKDIRITTWFLTEGPQAGFHNLELSKSMTCLYNISDVSKAQTLWNVHFFEKGRYVTFVEKLSKNKLRIEGNDKFQVHVYNVDWLGLKVQFLKFISETTRGVLHYIKSTKSNCFPIISKSKETNEDGGVRYGFDWRIQ